MPNSPETITIWPGHMISIVYLAQAGMASNVLKAAANPINMLAP